MNSGYLWPWALDKEVIYKGLGGLQAAAFEKTGLSSVRAGTKSTKTHINAGPQEIDPMALRAEMGVGTLIVFIAMLLVAAVAAGVLIQTAGSLQEQSLATGQSARSEISTHANAIEVSATEGRDGSLDDFDIIYKLSPGSGPIKLSQTLFSSSTKDTTCSMKMRDGLGINDVFLGYFTASGYPHTASGAAFGESVPQDFRDVFSSLETSEFMIGKIAVAIVFVESNGSVDANHENWTYGEEQSIINATKDALNWWGAAEPRANIKHTFEIHRAVQTSYEPITRDTELANISLWINQALDGIGAPAGADIFVRSRAYTDELRQAYNAHWGFVMFAVDSSHTPGGFGGIGGPAGIAYINGPLTFVASHAFGTRQDALIAHEFGHIFGARDQYTSSGCNCTDTGGYYSIETQNCDAFGAVCLTNTTSLMRSGAETVNAYDNSLIDVFALAQMGLIDANENNLLDPIDLLFEDRPDGANMTQEAINSLAGSYYNPALSMKLGFYTYDYMQEGTNHREGNLDRGDVLLVHFESARPIVEDEKVQVLFTPKIGTTTRTEFVTPDVISVERVYLYP